MPLLALLLLAITLVSGCTTRESREQLAYTPLPLCDSVLEVSFTVDSIPAVRMEGQGQDAVLCYFRDPDSMLHRAPCLNGGYDLITRLPCAFVTTGPRVHHDSPNDPFTTNVLVLPLMILESSLDYVDSVRALPVITIRRDAFTLHFHIPPPLRR